MKTQFIALIAATVSLSVHVAEVTAADPPKGQLTVTEMAAYQGPDRQELLLAAARKEGGEMSVYHVYPSLPTIITAFTAKYGIKVKAWRSG